MYRPHPEHTELEEELHEKARIDYDRVAIVRRLLHQLPSPMAVLILCPPDCQPRRLVALRRCSRLRNRLRHDLHRRPLRLLWSQDRQISRRQADSERGKLGEGCVVGTGEQGHDS